MSARRRARGWARVLAVGLGSGAVACASVDARTLHYVDGQLVSSRPISPVGYEAYLQARLALESDPPRLDEAAASIDEALRLDPDEPHLWTTRAEIADRAGDRDAALAAVRRALELAPDHEPARRLLTRLGGHGVAQTGAARAGHN